MMSPASNVFTPPAPEIFDRDLPAWRLIWNGTRSSLALWPDYAFDTRFSRNRTMGVETVLVNDPEGIRQVMTVNPGNYRRPLAIRRVGRPLGGDGVFMAEGATWRRQRRLLAPPFTPASIGILLPHFQEAGLHLLRSLEGRGRSNLSQAFQDTALEAVLRALFSMPEHDARARLGALVRGYVAGPGRPNLFDFMAQGDDSYAFASGGRLRFQATWFEAIAAIIRDRRARPSHGGNRDLLDLLLGLSDAETGETLADPEIRDQCATMFFAGSETTARLMFWASYLLSQDIDEQAHVRAEIAGFPPDRVGTLGDLQQWPRLRNVLLEALRLYPPIPHTLRDAIGPDEILGEPIAAKTQVWMSAWVMHRLRRYWEHPAAFLPDRFTGCAAPWVQTPGYFPFGVGPRICLGLNFALSEAMIVLARLLSRRRIAVWNASSVGRTI